jgi:hypothetical protein
MPERPASPSTPPGPAARSEQGCGDALEGATKADAVIVAPDTGFAVVFEANVLSDGSFHFRYDATRNQIARTLDVLMDEHKDLDPSLAARDPQRTCFVLLTPQLFKDEPSSRLYGWLMDTYRKDDELLAKHLLHRDKKQLAGTSRRLGWLSWEECNLVLPGARPWLVPSQPNFISKDAQNHAPG